MPPIREPFDHRVDPYACYRPSNHRAGPCCPSTVADDDSSDPPSLLPSRTLALIVLTGLLMGALLVIR